MSLISINRVSYKYAGKTAVKNVSFSVAKGDIISLLGPNGSGKTTLLKLIMGLYSPESGSVLIDGKSVNRMHPRILARRIAYVPQVHRIAFSYRIIDVVMMGRIPHKPFFFRYSEEDKILALNAMTQLSILHLRNRPYTSVSGGERQLCLIARALAQGADIFVMDEPVTGLDYGNQIRLLKTIRSLTADGLTFIQTTHFPDHALWLSDRVVMLKNGRVVVSGKADEVITTSALTELYNLDMEVAHTNTGVSVCVPGGMTFNSMPKASGMKQNMALHEAAI